MSSKCEELKNELIESAISIGFWMLGKSYDSYLKTSEEEKFFQTKFASLLKESHEHNYFWQYCSFSTYQKLFIERRNGYLNSVFDSTEADFINYERKLVEDSMFCDNFVFISDNSHSLRFYVGGGLANAITLHFINDPLTLQNIKISYQKKLDYLNKLGSESIERTASNGESEFLVETTLDAISKHEYNLRQFIDTALRCKIEAQYNGRTDNVPFPIVGYEVENARDFFESFKKDFINKLSSKPHRDAFIEDVHSRFVTMIDQYTNWYSINKTETQKFEPNNFYEWMFEIAKDTRAIIEQHRNALGYGAINKYATPPDIHDQPDPNLNRKHKDVIPSDNAYDMFVEFTKWVIDKRKSVEISFSYFYHKLTEGETETERFKFLKFRTQQHYMEFLNDKWFPDYNINNPLKRTSLRNEKPQYLESKFEELKTKYLV